MNILDLITDRTIKVGLASEEKTEVIAELVELLVRAGVIEDRPGVLSAIYERERKGTTGIGGGVAVPHAKHPSVKELVIAFGTSEGGIEFDAVDDELVHAVFLVLASPDDAGPAVTCLAEIANLLQVPGFYERLRAATCLDDVQNAIMGAIQAE